MLRGQVSGIIAVGGGGREKYFSRFLPNRPRPLSSFDTHARWQPVTQSARSRWSYGKIKGREQSMTTPTLQYLNTTGKNASNKVGNKTVPAYRVHIWVAKKDRFSRSTYPWQHLDTVTLFLRESRSCSLGIIVRISVLRWTDVFK